MEDLKARVDYLYKEVDEIRKELREMKILLNEIIKFIILRIDDFGESIDEETINT